MIKQVEYSAIKPIWIKAGRSEGLYLKNDSDTHYFFIYSVGLLGFGSLKLSGANVYLDNNFIFPELRGNGYGTELVDMLLLASKSLSCEQAIAYCLPPSLGIYIRAGFEIRKRIKKKDGTDTTMVRKSLL